MCFDQEKTQGVEASDRIEGGLGRAKEAFTNQFEIGHGIAGREMSASERLHEIFSYHRPTVETLPKFAAINQAAKNFAEIVLQNCPPGWDRRRAIDLIRDARMVANASVALNGLSL